MIGIETFPAIMAIAKKLISLRPNCQFVRSIANTNPAEGLGIRLRMNLETDESHSEKLRTKSWNRLQRLSLEQDFPSEVVASKVRLAVRCLSTALMSTDKHLSRARLQLRSFSRAWMILVLGTQILKGPHLSQGYPSLCDYLSTGYGLHFPRVV